LKKEFIQSIKIITLGLILSLSIGYLFAWTLPSSGPTYSDTVAPINTGNTVGGYGQTKGVQPSTPTTSLLEIHGALSADAASLGNSSMNTLQIVDFDDEHTTVTHPAPVCIDSVGFLYLCDSALPTHLLTIDNTDKGYGTVTSVPSGIDCGTVSCSYSYSSGETVSLTATAINSGTFSGWSGSECSGTGLCSFAMNGPKSITATFVPPPPEGTYLLTVNKNGTGTGTIVSDPSGMSCGPTRTTCSGSFDADTPVILTATATSGSAFSGWADCDSVDGNACTVTMTNAKTVVATFGVATTTVPEITTKNSVANITQTIATGGGTINANGGATITASGLVWSTSPNPTIANSKTIDGGLTSGQPWTSTMTGLSPVTTYYVRAYATNSAGTGYGSQISFTTASLNSLVVTTTCPPSGVASTTAMAGGNVITNGGSSIPVDGRKIQYGKTSTYGSVASASGGVLGAYQVFLSNLESNTLYYFRAYAVNNIGATAYGSECSFTTASETVPAIPTVVTGSVTNIRQNDAKGAGNTIKNGGSTVTFAGLVWGIGSNPTTDNKIGITYNGWATGGPWSSNMTGLTPNTTYHVRACATNIVGTAYGDDVTFTTTGTSSYTLSVSKNGSGTVTSNPTGIICGTATNCSYSYPAGSSITLTAFNDSGGVFTGWDGCNLVKPNGSCQVSMSEPKTVTATFYAGQSTVATSEISNISGSIAVGGGIAYNANLTADRGIVVNTAPSPTIESNILNVDGGEGNGLFDANMTGLAVGTAYHVRAFVMSNTNVVYGSEVDFTISPSSPNVKTTSVGSITQTSATVNGNVSIGTLPVTEKGIVWSTSVNPTVSGSKLTMLGGAGNISLSMTGLSPNTPYYVRTYVKVPGTVNSPYGDYWYGNTKTFTTSLANCLSGSLTEYSTSGNYTFSTFSIPGWPCAGTLKFKLWGAGGGGGGGAGAGKGISQFMYWFAGGGGGGGAGAYAYKGTPITGVAKNYNIVVGAKGTGGAGGAPGANSGSTGNTGGVTSIVGPSVGVYAYGGGGGSGSPAGNSNYGIGGTGGTQSGGDTSTSGSDGIKGDGAGSAVNDCKNNGGRGAPNGTNLGGMYGLGASQSSCATNGSGNNAPNSSNYSTGGGGGGGAQGNIDNNYAGGAGGSGADGRVEILWSN